jgi:hypothetical protein
MPSTAPSQHVAICSLTRRVLRCASEVISMQSARSSACNQLDAARLALHERERFPVVEHTQWRDQYEASRVAISRNPSQSVAISRDQYEAYRVAISRNQSQSVAHRTCTRESDSQ